MIKPNFYKQGDKKWTGYSWKGATVARNGCGPSAIANAVSVLGLLGHPNATPESVFKWMCKNGYMHPTQGTYYSGITACLKAYGVKKIIHTSNFSTVKKHLKKGDFCIGLPGKSRWTSRGHYILAYSMSGDNVLISDSASSDPSREKAPFSIFQAAIKNHPYPQVWIIDDTEQYVSKKGLEEIVKYAKQRASEGIPYTHKNPSWKGCDCHWFTSHVYKDCGYTDVYKAIAEGGKPYFWQKPYDKTRLGKYTTIHNDKGLDESKLLPGDIICKRLNANPNGFHSAIYISKGKIADATSKRGVSINKFTKKYIYAFRIPEKKKVEKAEKSQGVKMVKGFDISYVQKKITLDGFKKAKKNGWDFVIIRVGTRLNGKLYTDEEFESKYKNAIAAGLKVGVYFYSLATSISAAETEAKYVLKVLNGRKLQYPVFIDFEDPKTQGKLGKRLSKQICEAFCAVIEKEGYDAGVYSFYSWLNNNIEAISNKYYVWLAQYNDKDTYKGRHEMWQHSSKGKVPGIGYPIDVNVSQIPFGSYPVTKKTEEKPASKDTKKTVTYPTLPKRGYFQKGDKGVNVKRLQARLKDLKCYSSELDGIFGDKTLVGVKAFQRKYKLTVDGAFGKKSLATMKKQFK